MNKARSSFCDYSVSSGKCHGHNASRKTYSDYHTLDNFFPPSFPTLPGAKVTSHITMCSNCSVQKLIFLPFTLEQHLEVVCCILQRVSCAHSYKWHPPAGRITVLFNSLAAATILQLWILHLPGKKSALQVLLGFRFCDKIFLIILLLIGMSWPDSNASNYIVLFSLLFPLQMLFVTACKSAEWHCCWISNTYLGTGEESCAWSPKEIYLPPFEIKYHTNNPFLRKKKTKKTTWAWWVWCQKWHIETFVSNVFFISLI